MPPNQTCNLAATEKRPEIIEIAKNLNGVPKGEEYEKMISGMMYNPLLSSLLEARHRARGLAADYNNLDTKMISFQDIGQARFQRLEKLVGKVGENTFIEPPFLPDYGCNVSIGADTFINWG
ncbi:MAG: hypothetical protein M1836_003583 [Candelina mexicana]|nr:MAG: hypothetical protein M1836_003583 [Candelina mexicana]